MKKIILLLFVSFFIIKQNAKAQSPAPMGSFFCPETKELILVDWDGSKISGIAYGVGMGPLSYVEIKKQNHKPDEMIFEFSFLPPAFPLEYQAVVGFSPMGIVLIVNNEGESERREFLQIDAKNDKVQYLDPLSADVLSYVREGFWKKFEDPDTNIQLIAEDSQEGTAPGELMIVYKGKTGVEENLIAVVDETTFDLVFTSAKDGKLKAVLGMSEVVLFKVPLGQKFGTLYLFGE